MKTILNRNVLLLILSTSAISHSFAQISYTDINPNQVLTNSTLPIDMNNDGTVDFTIKQTSGIGVEIDLPVGNGVVIPPSPPGFADDLSCATLVSSSSNYYTAGGAVPMYAYSVGYWSGATDKCLGVKFSSGGTTHYGWIRLDVAASGNTATVKDYAYNTQAGQSINTCDMGSSLGIETIKTEAQFNVYPTIFDTYLTVETPETAACTIYDHNGSVVMETTVYYPKTSIGLLNLNHGFYLINLTDQSGKSEIFRVIKN